MRLGLIAVLAISLMLPGCEKIRQWRDPAINACREQLIEKLKSPSSYKEIEVTTDSSPISKIEYMRLTSSLHPRESSIDRKNPAIYSVVITYDAENSFGTALRSKEMCQFVADHVGQPPSDFSTKAAADIASGHTNPETGEVEPCCLTAFQRRDTRSLLP